MNIDKCSLADTNNMSNDIMRHNYVNDSACNPSFGSAAIDAMGSTMQSIQNGGFLVSFLIQDCLGMTLPRVGAAFLRDKDITGQYNVQEGFEVLGREGLTGPCMMAVAPIMFTIAALFCKSTSVNSRLIKRMGNSLKELVSKQNFDKTLLKNKDKFKQEFYKDNIKNILSNTIGKENVKEDSINYILKQLNNYEKIPNDAKIKGMFGKKKYRSKCMNNIVEHINDLKYKSSTELDMLGRIKFGSEVEKDVKTFNTKDVFDALIKYSDDTITLNKNLDKIDASYAESIKNKIIGKRVIANITTLAATLGVLSVLPKIYAKSDISPAAKTLMQMKENEKKENTTSDEVSFKGKAPKKSLLEKLGKLISKRNDKYAGELEYNGHNFTNTLMAGLSLLGLLAPRGARAYARAQVNEDGKKDLSELYEILIRDVTSSLAVIFAVPMLTRACISSYENKTGFVLLQKDRSRTGFKKFIDLINPYSNAHVMDNNQIKALYDNITTHDKMLNFCDYITKNDGDLEKIISKSENADKILSKLQLTNLTRKEKNVKITEHIKNITKNMGKEDADKLIRDVMKNSSGKINKIFSHARGLNSVPALLTTFLVSPYILGWCIPRLTYANTRRLHEKEKQAQASKVNATA
ncbi:MAG: hypothetical protein MJ231_01975 [bacterium]|nr:hypothetical protein [bacterium]